MLAVTIVLGACGVDYTSQTYEYSFGPFHMDPLSEQTDLCVAATLHNKEPLYVNAVDMFGGTGIHHSNWFWVPAGNTLWASYPDGSFSCAHGGAPVGGAVYAFDQQVATLDGGVLFAQSTQISSDTQAFPPGAVIRIPANARIIADVHLFNSSDAPLEVPLTLRLSPIPADQVTTILHGFAMENLAIALPAQTQSAFVVDCDLSNPAINMGLAPWSFHFFHALAHYHALGVGLTLEAIRDSDGGSDTIWSTSTGIGQELGGMLDPPFDMTGHSRLRLTCSYYNNTNNTVTWGNAGGEMCIAFGYTDSPSVWTAGIITGGDPGPSTVTNGVTQFNAPPSACVAAHLEAN